MVIKQATRAYTAEKISGANKNNRASNPELTTTIYYHGDMTRYISEHKSMVSEPTNVIALQCDSRHKCVIT